jgi:hypothetical protein
MPPHREDPEGGKGEQSDQNRAGCPNRAFYAVGEEGGKQSYQALGARPAGIVSWENRADGDGDAVRDQEDEARAEGCGSSPGECAEPFKSRERPRHSEYWQDDGAKAEHLPQGTTDRPPPAAGERHRQQRQAEEEAHQQGRYADELWPRLGIHAAMRRSA